MTQSPNITISKDAERGYSMISLDFVDVEAALDFAKRLAERTGHTVVVQNANHEHLGTFDRGTLN